MLQLSWSPAQSVPRMKIQAWDRVDCRSDSAIAKLQLYLQIYTPRVQVRSEEEGRSQARIGLPPLILATPSTQQKQPCRTSFRAASSSRESSELVADASGLSRWSAPSRRRPAATDGTGFRPRLCCAQAIQASSARMKTHSLAPRAFGFQKADAGIILAADLMFAAAALHSGVASGLGLALVRPNLTQGVPHGHPARRGWS